MADFKKGLYSCQITGQELTESKAGNPQICLRLTVNEFMHQDGTRTRFEEPKTRRVWLTITENTVDWVARDMSHLGFHGKPSQIDPESDSHIDLVDTVAEFWCSVEDDGAERWRVATPRSPSQVREIKKPDAESKARLDAKFGEAFAGKVSDSPKVSKSDTSGDDQPF